MQVPKRIREFLNKKQLYIDTQRDGLEKYIVRMQGNLLDEMIGGIYVDLDVKDGKILDTEKNYNKLREIDVAYDRFNKLLGQGVTGRVVKTTSELAVFGGDYFSMVLAGDMPSRFERVVQKAADLTNARIGITGEGVKRGGFLESLLKDKSIATDVKNFTSKAITGQMDTKDFVSGLRDLIKGVPKTVTKDGEIITVQTGALEKQYQQYAYDLYQQYDASYNSALSEEFGMNYFVYQGGLIEDSRDFCAAHNNKVWTREEAAEWGEWIPIQGEYPAGYQMKAKNGREYEIPSYLSYPGYQPLIDRGGYNCRHSVGWISDEMAYSLRPELKI